MKTFSNLLKIVLLIISLNVLGTEVSYQAPLKYVGQASTDVQNSFQSGNASLYSGQLNRSFPIFSLTTPNLPQVNASLQYSSNVFRTVNFENRDQQASWVGTGFQLSFESIIVEHHYTFDIWDDEYFYIGSGGAVKLIYKSDNTYYPSDASPWIFERVIDTLNGREHVIGWNLRREDSKIYKFGDFEFYSTLRNATSYKLAWANTVGVGTTGGDSLIAQLWSISRIQDLSGSNFITFSYHQDLDSIKLDNPSNNNYSDNHYTRFSYAKKITNSLGESIEFVLGDRTDYQNFLGRVYEEYYATKKLDSIYLRDSDNQILLNCALEYEYLNDTLQSNWKKLLLSGFNILNSGLTDSLPGTNFSYYTQASDINRGAIKEVRQPNGGMVKAIYKTIEADSNYSSLSLSDTVSITYGARDWSRSTYIGRMHNIFGTLLYYEVGSWNGYWKYQVLGDIFESQGRSVLLPFNAEAAAADGWAVLFKRDANLFIVLEDQGGTWARDTIIPSWNHESSGEIMIFPGDRFFVACEVRNGSPISFRRAYSYYKTPTGWKENFIVDWGDFQPYFGGVMLSNDIYALRVESEENNDAYKLFYGKYDFKGDSVVKGAVLDPWRPFLDFAVGVNYVAWIQYGTSQKPTIADYREAGWSISEVGVSSEYWSKSIIGLRSGIVWEMTPEGAPAPTLTQYAWRGVNSWNTFWEEFGSTNRQKGFGGNTFVVSATSEDPDTTAFFVRWWDGTGVQTSLLAGFSGFVDTSSGILATDEICAVYNMRDKSLSVKRFEGNNTWGNTELLINNLDTSRFDDSLIHVFDCSRNIVVATGVSSSDNDQEIRNVYRWKGSTWDTLDVSTITPPALILPGTHFPDTAFHQVPVAYTDRFSFSLGKGSKASFQYYGESCTGKPQYAVLDRIEVQKDTSDTNPLILRYSYTGGILDQGVSTPKFLRVRENEIHYADDSTDAKSFTLHYFHNDMTEGDPYFAGLDSLIDLPDYYYDIDTICYVCTQWAIDTTVNPPETLACLNYELGGPPCDSSYIDSTLTDFTGFMLDGGEFKRLAYDSSAQEIAGQPVTEMYNEMSVLTLSDEFGNRTYRVNIDSTELISDSIQSKVSYVYDSSTGFLSVSKTFLGSGKTRIDSTVYGYQYDPQLLQDNALAPVRESWSFLDSAGTRYILSRSRTDYKLSTKWLPVRKIIYPDLGDMTDTTTYLAQVRAGYLGSGTTNYDTIFIDHNQFADYLLYAQWYPGFDSAGAYIAVNGIVIDSIAISAGDTLNVLKSGTLPLMEQDTVEIMGYAYGTLAAGGVDFWYKKDSIGEVIIPFQILSDSSFDNYGNLLAWRNANGDTSGAKYSQQGAYKIANVSGGFVGNVFLFNAESDFDSVGESYDGWQNLDSSICGLTTSEFFTGTQSFTIDKPNNQTVRGLGRMALPDSMVRSEFMVSFWYKDSIGLTGFFEVLAFSGSDTTGAIYYGFQGQSSSIWEYHYYVFDLDSLGLYDSLKFHFGTAGAGQGDVYYDDIRIHPVDAIVTTRTFDESTGQLSSESGTDNYPIKYRYDEFIRSIEQRNFKEEILSKSSFYSSVKANGEYEPNDPNWVKNITFNDDDSTTSYTYYDGLGKVLQRRSSVLHKDTVRALVSGAAIYDARGRGIIQYKPYIDLITPYGIDNYSDSTDIVAEINKYYDGVNAYDTDSLPYTENRFKVGVKSKLAEGAGPGSQWSIGSGNTVIYKDTTVFSGDDTIRVSIVFDQDSIKTAAKRHHAGDYLQRISYYQRRDDTPDSVIVTNSSGLISHINRVTIDTSSTTNDINLGLSYVNDLAQVDSTWKVDYGTERFLYDKGGSLRFVQDENRLNRNRFVYFKYDKLGRKIEEGRMDDDTTYFNKSYAENVTFPDTSHSPVVRYRWYYDVYDTIVAPGMLVRVESGDTNYYKNFFYYPETNSDLVLIRLPFPVGTNDKLKGIRHEYHRDGSLKYLTVYPHYPDSSGVEKRKIIYNYYENGSLESIARWSSAYLDSLVYSSFEYNAEGAPSVIRQGVYFGQFGGDTLQKMDFTYNSLGALIGINDPAEVVAHDSLGVEGANDNDHFGLKLVRLDSLGNGFANGRIQRIISSNSTASGTKDHDYVFSYNEMGWLIDAEDSIQSTNLRRFKYNALGNRDTVEVDTNVISYVYDTVPGTSRIIRTSNMPSGDSLYYDKLGNLVADTANKRYAFSYYERNLLWGVTLERNLGPTKPHTSLTFYYDENGNRVMKKYTYYVLGSCGGGGGGGAPLGGEGFTLGGPTGPLGPGGGDTCAIAQYTYTYYLYDNGIPVAIFDGSDNVMDLFVNGPQGIIASYWQNSSSEPHYYFSDQISSSRLTMKFENGLFAPTPKVSSWYNYHPFGELMESSENYPAPYKFSAKQFDDESSFGLYHFGARYYDPILGRFISTDKASQFASGYLYANNNPISVIDPDGNFAILGMSAKVFLQFALGHYAGYQLGTSIVDRNGLGAAFAAASLVGIPTGVPNPWQSSESAGLFLAGSAVSNAVNTAGWNYLLGNDPKQGLVKNTIIGTALDYGARSIAIRGLNSRYENHLNLEPFDPAIEEIIITNSDMYAHSGKGYDVDPEAYARKMKDKIITGLIDGYEIGASAVLWLFSPLIGESSDIGLSKTLTLDGKTDIGGLNSAFNAQIFGTSIKRESYLSDPLYQNVRSASAFTTFVVGSGMASIMGASVAGGLASGFNYSWRGGELVVSSYRWNVLRVAPFGNPRNLEMIIKGIKNPWFRRLPHYHRRTFNPNGTIKTGIGKHRPLQGGF